MKIITNHQYRKLLSGLELTEEEKKDFDYLEGEQLDSGQFFRYKDSVYSLGEMMRTKNFGDYWDGYHGETVFSGVLVRLDDDWAEEVIVGRYYS